MLHTWTLGLIFAIDWSHVRIFKLSKRPATAGGFHMFQARHWQPKGMGEGNALIFIPQYRDRLVEIWYNMHQVPSGKLT